MFHEELILTITRTVKIPSIAYRELYVRLVDYHPNYSGASVSLDSYRCAKSLTTFGIKLFVDHQLPISKTKVEICGELNGESMDSKVCFAKH